MVFSYNYFDGIVDFSLKVKAAISVKISNLLICFCSFYLPCLILEKDNFIKHMYIVVLLNSVLFLTLFVLMFLQCKT